MPTRSAEAKPPTIEDKADLQTYTCERCGYQFKKVFDYPPYLCYRCMRFIAKRVWTIIGQIQPPVSRPEVSDV